jgi:hypothetical protein
VHLEHQQLARHEQYDDVQMLFMSNSLTETRTYETISIIDEFDVRVIFNNDFLKSSAAFRAVRNLFATVYCTCNTCLSFLFLP